MIPEQNTPEWEEMRKKMIGASDVPIILNLSPWKTPYQLWLEKTGRKQNKSTFSMEMGKIKEDEIREHFGKEIDCAFMPKVVFHNKHKFLMASLDGINFNGNVICEIKTTGHQPTFDKALNSEVPEYYMAQIQTQLACTPEARHCWYVCSYGSNITYFRVRRDTEFLDRVLPELEAFYDCMINDYPPELTERDTLLIENDPDFEEKARKWKEAKKRLNDAEALEKMAREALIELTDDGNCEGYGVSVKRAFRSSVNYKQACLDAQIDIKKYTKPSIGYWSIREASNDTK